LAIQKLVILPLLETPLEDLILACVEQRVRNAAPLPGKLALLVVAAAGGYPRLQGQAIRELRQPSLGSVYFTLEQS